MSYVHNRTCEGFIIDDDEVPTIGNVSCAHLAAYTLRCKFFLNTPRCDDLVLVQSVPLSLVKRSAK